MPEAVREHMFLLWVTASDVMTITHACPSSWFKAGQMRRYCTARSEVSLALVCLPAVRTVQAEADGLACFKVPASIAVAQALAM